VQNIRIGPRPPVSASKPYPYNRRVSGWLRRGPPGFCDQRADLTSRKRGFLGTGGSRCFGSGVPAQSRRVAVVMSGPLGAAACGIEVR